MASEPLSAPNYTYAAKVLRVVDGDTYDFLVDLGFRTFTKVRGRLWKAETPEVYGVKKESEEYQRGQAASAFAKEWLGMVIPGENENFQRVVLNSPQVLIRSHDGKPLGQGKYGRWIVEVFKPGEATSLNEALIQSGHAEAVEY